jgi:hypothetical protein
VSGFNANAWGHESLEHNAKADDLDYQYPAADQTVARPPRRGGNVRIAPAKAKALQRRGVLRDDALLPGGKARRLLQRGAISREAAERHAPDLIISIGMPRPKHDYRREGVVKDDTVEASSA